VNANEHQQHTEATARLADNILAIACATTLYDLAVREPEVSPVVDDFGLSPARVSSAIISELDAFDAGRAACLGPEVLEQLAAARGHAGIAGLTRWLRDARSKHTPYAVQIDALDACADRLLIGGALIHVLSRLRSNEPGFDAFAYHGMVRSEIFELARATAERFFVVTRDAEAAWRLIANSWPESESGSGSESKPARHLRVVSDREPDATANEASVLEQPSPALSLAPSPPENVGALLAKLRLERGLTRNQLAARAGLSLSTVRAIEVGERDAKLESAKALAGALDLPFVEFAAMIAEIGGAP
jgi:DNA-binding XRE family transcriptional regulator